MRLLTPSFTIFILWALTLSFQATAQNKDTYSGPVPSLQQRDVKAADVKQDQKWDRNFEYRVEEDPYNLREVASEKEAQNQDSPKGRDPSSTVDPLKFEFESDVKKWKWQEKSGPE